MPPVSNTSSGVSASILIAVLAMSGAFIFDRIKIQMELDEIKADEMIINDLRKQVETVRERQRTNEDRIMRLEDGIHVR